MPLATRPFAKLQEDDMHKASNQTLLAVAAWLLTSSTFAQTPASGNRDFEQTVQDAWIDGRLESTYIFNDHLSAAAIRTDVRNGVVTLTGKVDSDIDRDLAAEIAKGLKGVVSVDNRLEVAGEPDRERPSAAAGADRDSEIADRRSFGQWVNDATTSAAVKSALIGNENIRARDIDVNTDNDVVTLRGMVATEQQKQLAEQLAKNTRDVKQVRNELRVDIG
jgi:hyperosmotically inducible periplasmic protein